MRIPKSVNICGKKFVVTTNPEHDGGSADASTCKIEIGTMKPDEIAENFVHEVGEAIMMVRDFRFVTEREEPDNGDYRFILNHKDWELFAKDLAIALRGVKFDPVK